MTKTILSLALLMATLSLGATENNMKSILIVHASFSGSTAEVAGKMKASLDSMDFKTRTVPAESAAVDFAGYDLVILGSAIRGDAPHPAILKFIDSNRAALSRKKTAVFAVCATITSSKDAKRQHALTYPGKIANGLNPSATAVFGGVLSSSNWFANLMGKLILGVKPGDYRDWGKINTWTVSLAKVLS